MEARKRRKWDVAAPGGMPLSGHRAGIGAIGSGKAAKTGLSGFITAQGLQIDPPEALEPVSAPVTPAVPARPLSEQEIVARAKQEAQAVVERINAVRTCPTLTQLLHSFCAIDAVHKQFAGAEGERSVATWTWTVQISR